MMIPFLALVSCAPKQHAPALDLTDLDTTVSPKVDFYQYATGGWQAKNPLKPEFSRYGSFDAIAETTREQLNELFASMAEMNAKRGSVEQKISDLYKMALDSTTRNSLGAAPIQPYIDEIRQVKDLDAMASLLGRMNLYGEGGFYGAGVESDLADSDMQVLYLGQGGLGMGDRDYYLKEENARLKDAYKEYLVKVLTLSGIENPEEAVSRDIEVETAMAEVSWTREQNRNMMAVYNPMSTEEICSRWPSIRFDRTCQEAGIPAREKVIVEQPSYFDGLDRIFSTFPLESLRDYLLCQFISGQAGSLSDDFYTASWEFFSHEMSGAQEQQPRWKRAMRVPNSILGEAVGQMYVSRYFPESSKKKMVALVENLRTALGEHIDALDWMSDTTKVRAREKLASFTVKIGYPDKWKDYSTLDINPDNTYYENLRNARLTTRELAKEVNLSTTPVFERIKRLEKEGYIREYTAVLDADLTGPSIPKVFGVKEKAEEMRIENAGLLEEKEDIVLEATVAEQVRDELIKEAEEAEARVGKAEKAMEAVDSEVISHNTLQEKYLKLAEDALTDNPDKSVAQQIMSFGKPTGYVKVLESDWKKMLRIFRITSTKEKAVEQMAKDMAAKDSKIKYLTDTIDKCKSFLKQHNLYEAFMEHIKPKEHKRERVSLQDRLAKKKVIVASQDTFKRTQDQHKKQEIAI